MAGRPCSRQAGSVVGVGREMVGAFPTPRGQVFATAALTRGSRVTRRWRKAASNRWSPLQSQRNRGTGPIVADRQHPSCILIPCQFNQHLCCKWDQRFESAFLQRGVRCEPISRGNSPSYVASVTAFFGFGTFRQRFRREARDGGSVQPSPHSPWAFTREELARRTGRNSALDPDRPSIQGRSNRLQIHHAKG